jgi:hypothetical protein
VVRGAVPGPADEHWAPDHLVLARHTLSYAGRLLVVRDEDGQVLTHSPLEGMAAVEHRYPAWAQGPFGEVEPERRLSTEPGVFALVQAGAVRYVGSTGNLRRTFGPRGLGEISRSEAQSPRHEESCRLNRLVVAEARAGRTVDLYVLPVARQGVLRRPAEDPAVLAGRIVAVHRGVWHKPA